MNQTPNALSAVIQTVLLLAIVLCFLALIAIPAVIGFIWAIIKVGYAVGYVTGDSFNEVISAWCDRIKSLLPSSDREPE